MSKPQPLSEESGREIRGNEVNHPLMFEFLRLDEGGRAIVVTNDDFSTADVIRFIRRTRADLGSIFDDETEYRILVGAHAVREIEFQRGALIGEMSEVSKRNLVHPVGECLIVFFLGQPVQITGFEVRLDEIFLLKLILRIGIVILSAVRSVIGRRSDLRSFRNGRIV
ncbi:MAG: hypothetical protein BWY50_02023 [Spirochaetes bacterium ADurb.Bin315]|nr:MAG: hypothetical protein BWY50_02023 [Spirochaetes bacterium ADurb.Bin315]